MITGRQWHNVDLLKLYNFCSTEHWNNFLTICVARQDVLTLQKTYYGCQAGMDKLAKDKLNSEKIVNWYLRLIKSIEQTVKTIYRIKYPTKLDDPITAQSLKVSNPIEYQKHINIKRERDLAYEAWLTKASF